MQKDKIGPYKIISKAGEGAFGIVWMTENTKDNKKYAIKEISKKRMTPQLIENLVREVHISFNLKHLTNQ
jgi:serine/threonine protein kinase